MASEAQVVEARLEEIARGSGGRFGFFARDLLNGRTIARLADEVFPTASLIKVAILVELERRVLEGTLSMTQELTLRDEDRVGGSSLLRHMSAGIRLPLRDWAYLMMAVSDNTATNVLIDLVGLEAVNATMTRSGFEAVRLHHKIDFKALWHDTSHLGTGTPRAFAELMEAILERRLLTPAACEDMLRLMDGVGAGERLARYVPYNPYAAQQREQGIPAAETGPLMHFAGKTGSLTGVRTHAGVLWSDEVPVRLAMCAMAADSTDRTWTGDAAPTLALARAGQLAYEVFAGTGAGATGSSA
ncbi:MAG TPA: serine hydrolase [Chloroflexota bacterium]|jgi:beta-lactamase class A|nr:serine hydrolase [Chloroflexota bacterium]